MFRRRTSLDSDAVSLAQRRLAALAEHLAPAKVPAGEVPDETALRVDPATPFPTGRAASGRQPSVAPAVIRAGGRHRGRPRASELGQWSVNRNHVAVVALVSVVLVLLAVWWVLRAAPHGEPVRLVSSRSMPSQPVHADATAGPTGSGLVAAAAPVQSASTPGQVVVVDVAGKVRHPGIVELPAGSRVVDALQAVGGARPGVDTTNLNLARLLVDGEQIIVGASMPSPGRAPSIPSGQTTPTATTSPVNINTATEPDLEALPDVGPVTAQSIIDYRTQNGSFTSVDQLIDVSGIGEKTLADLRPYVYV